MTEWKRVNSDEVFRGVAPFKAAVKRAGVKRRCQRLDLFREVASSPERADAVTDLGSIPATHIEIRGVGRSCAVKQIETT